MKLELGAAAAAALLLLLRARLRRKPRLIAFLNTEDAPKWADQLDVFAAALALPHECFERFDCFAGEFPTPRALRSRYAGVLITGSHFSAVDPSLPWLPALFETIREAAAVPRLNVLGCCFGCQAAAVALGGEVGANPAAAGFTFGHERVDLDAGALVQHHWAREALESCSASPAGGGIATVGLLESHGEQVGLRERRGSDATPPPPLPSPRAQSPRTCSIGPWRPCHPSQWTYPYLTPLQVTRLPEGALALGWSETAPHELFLAGPFRNVLCCQSHPEFDKSILSARIAPALLEKGRLSAAQLELELRAMDERPTHSRIGRALYRAFLLRDEAGASAGAERCAVGLA